MLDIGGWEFLVVAFVLIMVVGPKELPKMLRGFTRVMRQVRNSICTERAFGPVSIIISMR